MRRLALHRTWQGSGFVTLPRGKIARGDDRQRRQMHGRWVKGSSFGGLFEARPLKPKERAAWRTRGRTETLQALRRSRQSNDDDLLIKSQPLPKPKLQDLLQPSLSPVPEQLSTNSLHPRSRRTASLQGDDMHGSIEASSLAPASTVSVPSARRAQNRLRSRYRGKIENPCWNEATAKIDGDLRTNLFGELPVKHVDLDPEEYSHARRDVVENYLLRVDPLLEYDGYICSLPSLRKKVRFVVDHPLLLTYMKFITRAVPAEDKGEPDLTVFGAAGFRGSSPLRERRAFVARGREVIFAGSFNTDEFREATSVGLANVLQGEALLMRSAVMARGRLQRRRGTISGPSIVIGIGSGRGDYSGHNHIWTDAGLSFVWYGDTWDPRRHLFRAQPGEADLVEGARKRATRRIPMDTPPLLTHPENVTCCFAFGTTAASAYDVNRPEELAYTFLLSGGSPVQHPSRQYDNVLEFLRLVRRTPKNMSAVWGYKAQQVAKKVAEGHSTTGGKIGRPDRARAERFREQFYPHIPCNGIEVVVRSEIPFDAAPGWQPEQCQV